MPLLHCFDAPAFLADLDPVDQEAWSRYIASVFDCQIDVNRKILQGSSDSPNPQLQFFNPAASNPGGNLLRHEVTWNAFPRELLLRFGRARAMIEADRLWPWPAYQDHEYDPLRPGQAAIDARATKWYRPQDEYCEWHVDRHPDTNAIQRVTFSSEPPEYWNAVFGGKLMVDDDRSVEFAGNAERGLALYQDLVDPDVKSKDLFFAQTSADGAAGTYNAYNKWNSTHGIAHLACPPNALQAEIKLAADATLLYANARGQSLSTPDSLICCAGYGSPDRNSDPVIGAAVNALAREGALVTLPNPVGLYMDHIDLAGWSAPDGLSPCDCVRIVRGRAGMISRMVVELPPGSRGTVSDITIGGEAIRYGGQIAECISVKLVAGAVFPGVTMQRPQPCYGRCCIEAVESVRLRRSIAYDLPTPIGMIDAFIARHAHPQDAWLAARHAAPKPKQHATKHGAQRARRRTT